MQTYSCLVAGLTPMAGLTLVTDVCLLTSCLLNHMLAYHCLVAGLILIAGFSLMMSVRLANEMTFKPHARVCLSSGGVYSG